MGQEGQVDETWTAKAVIAFHAAQDAGHVVTKESLRDVYAPSGPTKTPTRIENFGYGYHSR